MYFLLFFFPLFVILYDTRNANWCSSPSLLSLSVVHSVNNVACTVGSRFTTVPVYDGSVLRRFPFYDGSVLRRFTFYDPCPVGPSTLDLRCVTVATEASFLYLVRFWLFSGVQVFLIYLF